MSVDFLESSGKVRIREFTRAYRAEEKAGRTLKAIERGRLPGDANEAARAYEAALRLSRPATVRLVAWMRSRRLSAIQYGSRLFVDASSDRGDTAHQAGESVDYRVLMIGKHRVLVEGRPRRQEIRTSQPFRNGQRLCFQQRS